MATKVKYPYSYGSKPKPDPIFPSGDKMRSEFHKAMKTYKDTPGPFKNGSLGDGTALQRTGGKGWESKGGYADKVKGGKESMQYAEDTKNRGGGWAAQNAYEGGKRSVAQGTAEGTAARHKLIAKYNAETTTPHSSPDPHTPNYKVGGTPMKLMKKKVK